MFGFHLEYTTPVWNLHTKEDNEVLKKYRGVQLN